MVRRIVPKATNFDSMTDDEVLDIRQTDRPFYTFSNIASDEWQIADKKNCPMLGGEAVFGFGEAIKYLKRGFKVARKGWNGKKQYIQLASGISYKTSTGDIVNCEHDIGTRLTAGRIETVPQTLEQRSSENRRFYSAANHIRR